MDPEVQATLARRQECTQRVWLGALQEWFPAATLPAVMYSLEAAGVKGLMNLGGPSELERATPEVVEHFHWPRMPEVVEHFHWPRSTSSSQQPESHVGLHAAAGADEMQPEQLNMMCEEPLPLCPECHQVCTHCAAAY
ncbi:unnamed protein product [Polarella glacialis]|nr:unnamed protein product [Polarella glacialis]